MKVLVIGGNRFFGRRLVARLVEHKFDVTLLNRQSVDDGFGDQVRRIKCDRSDERTLASAIGIQRFDVVFDQVCYDALEARAAVKIFAGRAGRYIFTSTQSVYNRTPGLNLNESAFSPRSHTFSEAVDWRKNYGEGKRQAEAVFFNESKLNLAAARFPFVLGTDDYTKRLHFHVERIKAGQAFYVPNLEAQVSLIDAQDAADALFILGTSEYKGPINCCSPDAISMRQLLDQIETVTGKKAHLLGHATNDADASPYGQDTSSTMDIGLAKAQGLRFKPLSRWLPDLIKSIAKK